GSRSRARPRALPGGSAGQPVSRGERTPARRDRVPRPRARRYARALPVGRRRSAADSASVQALAVGLVGGLVHGLVHLALVAEAKLEEPASAQGIAVDGGRLIGKRLIHLDHLTGSGREDLACRLHRFHHGDLLALLRLAADLRELDEYHVAELRLRIVRDADGADVAL